MAGSRYAQWRPTAAPIRYAVCLWTRENPGARPTSELIVPDGCVDLIWCEGRLELVGPDRAPWNVVQAGGTSIAGLRLRPGAAGLLLGRVPTTEVCDQRVPLTEYHGDRARWLAERLALVPGPAAAARMLDEYVASLRPAYRPDPAVEHTVAVLGRREPVRLLELADEVGLSERQLRRRFTQAVGYGPKGLHAVLRFQRALALHRSSGSGLAEVAADAGYADQAHLSREVRRLSGRTPSMLLTPVTATPSAAPVGARRTG